MPQILLQPSLKEKLGTILRFAKNETKSGSTKDKQDVLGQYDWTTK
jgi:hypothetical protein